MMKARPLIAVVGLVAAGGIWLAFRESGSPQTHTARTMNEGAGTGISSPPVALPQRPSGNASSVRPQAATFSELPNSSPSAPGVVPSIAPSMPLGLPPTATAAPSPSPAEKGIEENSEARTDVESVQLMLRDYRTLMGENPVGTNAEIMKILMGGNPKQATLGPPEGQGVNANGELIDRWGTPYFFHQLAKDQMEIRSAGPDKKMGTDDDTVGR